MTILTNTYPAISIQSHEFAKWLDIPFMQSKNIQEIRTEKTLEQGNSLTEILKTAAVNSNQIFVDFSQEDKNLSEIVRTELNSSQVVEDIDLFRSNNSADMLKQSNTILRQGNTVIILYDQAPLDWLVQRLIFYRRIRVRYFNKFSIRVIEPIWHFLY